MGQVTFPRYSFSVREQESEQHPETESCVRGRKVNRQTKKQ